MKHIFTVLILSFLIQSNIQGQYTEAGIFFGVSNYHGDLTPKVMEVQGYAPSFGAFGRYNFNGHLAAKLHFYKGILQGSDFNAQITKGNRERNLSFRTDLFEVGLQMEYNFLDFQVSEKDHITTPYVFAGVAGIYYNPQAEINGQWFDLQELGTEGQGLPGYAEKYSKVAIAIPAGVGVKFNINHAANIGLEMGMRYAFTDYLDDVSTVYPDLKVLTEEVGEFAAALSYRTPEYDEDIAVDPEGLERGDAKTKDLYFFGGLTLSINIGKANGFSTRQKTPTRRQKKAPKMQF